MHSLIKELNNKKLIAIEGEPGAGKSTLANYLKNELDANLISIDDFYLPIEKRDSNSFSKGGNNIDFKRLLNEVISKHIKKEKIEYKSYNCQTNEYSKVIKLEYRQTLIIEGSYVLRSDLFDYFDYKILLTVSKDLQDKRLVSRINYQDFLTRWIPLSKDFIIDNNIMDKADYIIENLNL